MKIQPIWRLWRLGLAITVALLIGSTVGLLAVGAEPNTATKWQSRPTPTRTPQYDEANLPKTMVVKLEVRPNGVTLDYGWIIHGYAHIISDGAPELRVQLLDYQNQPLEDYYVWSPLKAYRYDASGRDSSVDRQYADLELVFPFNNRLKTLILSDVDQQKTLIKVDLEQILQNYCLENPDDPECVPDLVVTFEGPEGNQAQIGTLVRIPVTVENKGGDTVEPGILVHMSLMEARPSEPLLAQRFEITIPLQPGDTLTEEMVLAIPDDFPPGEYILEVAVDPENRILELDKDNNTSAIDLTIIPMVIVP